MSFPFEHGFWLLDIAVEYEKETNDETLILIGKTLDGTTIMKRIKNFSHEFFVAISPIFDQSSTSLEQLKEELNHYLLTNQLPCKSTFCQEHSSSSSSSVSFFNNEPCKDDRARDESAIRSISVIQARGFTGYEPKTRNFIRFELTRSYYANYRAQSYLLNTLLEHDHLPPELKGCYEMVKDPVESYMRQTHASGFDWFDLESGERWKEQPSLDVRKDLKLVLKEFIYDIETISESGITFAERGHPVGSIYVKCRTVGRENESIHGFILVGKSTRECVYEGMNQDQVRIFDTELELLETFHTFFMEFDPDVIIGYNSNLFDFPYICNRMRLLRSSKWNKWSRLDHIKHPLKLINRVVSTNQTGAKNSIVIYCPGRLFLDVWILVRGDSSMKLEGTSLAMVCEYLKIGSKDDLPYDQLYTHFHGDETKRGLLAKYNKQDVLLTDQVYQMRSQLNSVIAGCQIFHVLPKHMIDKGLSYLLEHIVLDKIYGKRLRPTRSFGYHPYVDRTPLKVVDKDAISSGEDEVYSDDYSMSEKEKEKKDDKGNNKGEEEEDVEEGEVAVEDQDLPHPCRSLIEGEYALLQTTISGGYVTNPKKGYYHEPYYTFVLDFNSLYPSLIRSKNICHTTILRNDEHAKQLGLVLGRDYHVSPCGVRFVNPELEVGVIPEICVFLVEQRNVVKKLQGKERKGSSVYLTLESVQSAYKTAANALYGQFAMKFGALALLVAGQSITLYGKTSIIAVKKYIRTCEELKRFRLKIVYGDTDSIMVVTKADSLDHAREIFSIVHSYVNEKSGIMQYPMKMGKDAMYSRYLLLNPKNYMGCNVSVEPGSDPEPKRVMKGVAFIKRDKCKYIRECGTAFADMLLLSPKTDFSKLYDQVRIWLEDLFHDKVDRSKLQMSIKIAKPLEEYKNSNAIHVVAANQLIGNGIPVQPGDRIKFYYCMTPKVEGIPYKRTKVYDMVVAEQFVDSFYLYLLHYANLFVNAFEYPLIRVFGRLAAKKLMDLTRYTSPLAKSVLPPLVYVPRGERSTNNKRIMTTEGEGGSKKKKQKKKQKETGSYKYDISQFFTSSSS